MLGMKALNMKLGLWEQKRVAVVIWSKHTNSMLKQTGVQSVNCREFIYNTYCRRAVMVAKLIFLIMIMMILTSCTDTDEPLGDQNLKYERLLPTVRPDITLIQKDNMIRSTIGMREIQDDWWIYRNRTFADRPNERQVVWKSPDAKGATKWVLYRKEVKCRERDNYYSGRTFLSKDPDGGRCSEVVVLEYIYGRDQIVLHYVGDNEEIEKSILELKEKENEGDNRMINNAKVAYVKSLLERWNYPTKISTHNK